MMLKSRMPTYWINEVEITQLMLRCLALAHFVVKNINYLERCPVFGRTNR
jgi:hypothetical protein